MGNILRRYGAAWLRRYPHTPLGVQQVLARLAACRTPALGGHVSACSYCGAVRYRYHSCGDRHCPACGGHKRGRWLEQRRAELLPVPYFHVVFTLPHQLSALVLGNRRQLYPLLMRSAAQTLLEVAANPSIWERGSAFCWCCIPGASNSSIIRTCMPSSPAAAWRWRDPKSGRGQPTRAGLRAGPTSCCR